MGFFLTLLYIAIIFIRPQDFISAMRGWPILDWMAILTIGVCFLEGEFTATKFRRSPLNALMLWFWAAVVLSQFTNLSSWYTRMAFQDFAKVVIVYFLVMFTVTTLGRLKTFIWFLVLMSLVLSLQAILQYYTGVGLFGGEAIMRGEVMQVRGIGIFNDPNDLALNLITFIPFVLPGFHRGLMSPTVFTGYLLLVPMVTGLVYTRSRGGVLGFAAVMWWYFHKRVGTILSVGALMLLFSLLLTIPRMGSVTSGSTDTSMRMRMSHWSRAMVLLRQHPVFGQGYLSFSADYGQTAHNSFAQVISELGFLGAYVWVALFFQSFRSLIIMGKIPNAPPWLEKMVGALTGAMIGWLVSGYFLSQAYKFTEYILMAMVVAMLNVLEREGYLIHLPWDATQLRNNFFLTIGAIIFLYVSTRLLWMTV